MAAAKFIEKHLTCSICQEEYKDPRRLTCQHVYCTKCLQGHINATAGDRYIRRRNEWIIGFNCPECRKTIRIPRPHESAKSRWATQISADFKTANMQADIREGTYVISDPIHLETDMEAVRIAPREERVQAQNQTTRDRSLSQNTQREAVTVVETQNVEADPEQRQTIPAKRTEPVKGKLVRVVSPVTEDKPAELYDIEVLVQGKNRIIVTLDFQKNKIITLSLNGEMKLEKIVSEDLKFKPWRVCKVNQHEVAVTVSEPDGVLLCNIDSDITFERLFSSNKHYDGIGVLPGRRFVLTTSDNVDIVKYDGTVLQEFKISAPHVKYSDNSYVSCTLNQSIVVTDCSGKTVSCVNQEGKVIWRKKMSPLGVACDSDGSIYFVDNETEVVYLFTTRGRFVCKVLEKSENFYKPSGIAGDGTGYLYVICDFKNISVWELCSCGEEIG